MHESPAINLASQEKRPCGRHHRGEAEQTRENDGSRASTRRLDHHASRQEFGQEGSIGALVSANNDGVRSGDTSSAARRRVCSNSVSLLSTGQNCLGRESPRSVASVGEAALTFSAGENECQP